MGRYDDRARALNAHCGRRAFRVRARVDPRPYGRGPRVHRGERRPLGPQAEDIGEIARSYYVDPPADFEANPKGSQTL